MQKRVESLRDCLSEHFDAKARIDGAGVKINVKSLTEEDIFVLSRIVRNTSFPLEIKRSGTGLLVVFKC